MLILVSNKVSFNFKNKVSFNVNIHTETIFVFQLFHRLNSMGCCKENSRPLLNYLLCLVLNIIAKIYLSRFTTCWKTNFCLPYQILKRVVSKFPVAQFLQLSRHYTLLHNNAMS